MNKSLEEVASARLDTWGKDGLWRSPSVFTRGQVPESFVRTAAEHTARQAVLFSSSNYLGLAEHPEIKSAVKDSVDRYGVGSGGSRLTTGTSDLHVAVEAAAARLTGYPDAVFFATGYQANLSTLQAVASPELTIISDARNHASIIDGCRLAKASGASLVVTPHRDTRAVEAALATRTTKYALVVTDGLFSMDGVLAPLPELTRVAREYGAWLMVDDAHSFGTVGDRGLGLPEYFGVQPDIQVITASKALGAEGGLVATSKPVAQLLRQQARSFVFSTSPAPATSAAVLAALKLMEADPSPVRQLQDNISYWHHTRGTTPQQGPIIPVHVGNEAAAMSASAALLDRGLIVPAIRWPTVARGAALLRVTLMATHTRTQINALCAELEQLGL
ncbi:aminotransferase class I/II-fold pyridoxal phosphate-dependent enzyme [Corynebacterium macginleyi]|uniref:8-amino-7-oxononanoate synthase n=1 Tax=Corynebacterium macginleyi TaxID=38290 RepID=A0ABS1Y4U9_9CORY|nr:8-amino-7-oxononanoate synthase [Corynebacterium macginleyi]MBK4149941.1 aminotransferase class I/II-fold pyridoxal phosphate-dependent enzyme [Corynebacterium macginleyi]MBK4174046.1 aminotransferase class I/II-fold pyridoxal phosphate-dependent enzyme [Corynebacterium macginleyi]MBK4181180.1 aminotransferase class I/II-fold pyridoxal phosphate-dependent enzyme [Corynebacterium macginleyi]MBK4181847.1 aminotransferase class I/II-fold pyridoxal phosphate-dependent enzyme [Corynebacterium mac